MASLAKRFGRLLDLKNWNKTYQNRLHSNIEPRTFRRNMSSNSEVVMETKNSVGVITLNRAKALNALSLNMIRAMHPQIVKWKAEGVKMILVKGVGGKAFCAGGDIRSLMESVASGGTVHEEFFKEEYILNHTIATLPFPYVALIDGITMGGGVGISVHGRFRLATEKTLFAMPETGIGLIPDVGGGYFLPRLRGQLGTYLALTGFRLKGRDAYHAGIATHFCASSQVAEVEQELLELADPSVSNVAAILDSHHAACKIDQEKPFSLEEHMGLIDQAFDASTIEEILHNLEACDSPWALKQVQTIQKMSPTSLKISLEQMRRGANLSLEDVLTMEYRLSQGCMHGHDFSEGVRAVLVDKDNAPKWSPCTLSDVTQGVVEEYFKPLPKDKDLVF